jgi:hypothetical protein
VFLVRASQAACDVSRSSRPPPLFARNHYFGTQMRRFVTVITCDDNAVATYPLLSSEDQLHPSPDQEWFDHAAWLALRQGFIDAADLPGLRFAFEANPWPVWMAE